MKKILAVARWEFIEKVKTKTFIVSLILTPAIIIAFSIAPTLLSDQEVSATKAIGVVDTSGLYFNGMQEEIQKYKLKDNQPNYILINLTKRDLSFDELKKSADKDVIEEKIEGYLLIINGGTDSIALEFRGKTAGNLRDIKRLENVFNDIRIRMKLDEAGIHHDLAEFLSTYIEINQIIIEESGKESKRNFLVTFFSSFIFIMLLMMMILYTGGMLIRSLVEEKSNRLIEILISSCSTDELLAGKIIGLSALGLAQILIWILIGISLAGSAVVPLEAFENILPIMGYFILGFVFYTSLFVGIGSIVTSEQEAQQITTYLSFVLVLPVIFVFPALENPDAVYVQVLSFIPFTLPSFMMLRINIRPIPIWEIITTVVIMLSSIYLMILLSARIFRIGILSYGKRPSLKEIFKWLREG
jgi:ABC-2 type transport system permease protein